LPLAAHLSVYTKIYIVIFVPIYAAKINFSISRLNIGIYLHFHWINLEIIFNIFTEDISPFCISHGNIYEYIAVYIKHL